MVHMFYRKPPLHRQTTYEPTATIYYRSAELAEELGESFMIRGIMKGTRERRLLMSGQFGRGRLPGRPVRVHVHFQDPLESGPGVNPSAV